MKHLRKHGILREQLSRALFQKIQDMQLTFLYPVTASKMQPSKASRQTLAVRNVQLRHRAQMLTEVWQQLKPRNSQKQSGQHPASKSKAGLHPSLSSARGTEL